MSCGSGNLWRQGRIFLLKVTAALWPWQLLIGAHFTGIWFTWIIHLCRCWLIRTNDNGYYDVRRCLSLCCEMQFHSCDIDRNDYLKPPQDYVSVVTVCLSAPSRCISFVGHHVTSFSVEPPVRFWQNQERRVKLSFAHWKKSQAPLKLENAGRRMWRSPPRLVLPQV